MHKALLVLAAALALLSATAASPAHAAKVPCPIDENGNCLPSSDGYATEDASDYVYYADGSQTCKAVWARRNFNSYFGDVFYRYYQQVNWCFRNGTITSFARYRWAETNWPWIFDGHVSDTCSDETCSVGHTGVHQTSVYTWGQFHACVVPWAVCNYNIPWVRVTVNGYGGWGYATGG
jgi:hypothetical protein